MSEAYDIMEWLRDSAPPGPLGRRMAEAADEIANLREEISGTALPTSGQVRLRGCALLASPPE
jgi:hypothetical protein